MLKRKKMKDKVCERLCDAIDKSNAICVAAMKCGGNFTDEQRRIVQDLHNRLDSIESTIERKGFILPTAIDEFVERVDELEKMQVQLGEWQP